MPFLPSMVCVASFHTYILIHFEAGMQSANNNACVTGKNVVKLNARAPRI